MNILLSIYVGITALVAIVLTVGFVLTGGPIIIGIVFLVIVGLLTSASVNFWKASR